MNGETIAALATAPGPSGVAVVRVSGPDAFALAERLAGPVPEPGRFELRFLRRPDGSRLDQALVLAFRAPRSYTGEDVVEFQCHGGTVSPRRVLEAVLSSGARLARRGEFTERAFLNGKLDYDQAESVLDLVEAKTDRAAEAALEGLSGRHRRELETLYHLVLDLSAELEHALDIDEGELPVDFMSSVEYRLASLADAVSAALRQAAEGRLLRAGAMVVLAGPPNAGKSSLMNALLEENRAIVSDEPGTTRDAIEAWLDLGGWPVRLVDTAGLRETANAIEAEGVRRAEELIATADVVLVLRDVTAPAFSGTPADPRVLQVRTKADLRPCAVVREGDAPGLFVSSKTGEGLAALKEEIVTRLERRANEQAFAETTGDVSERTRAILLETLALLPRTCEDLVLAADALHRAAEKLGAAIGAIYTEDLLTNLFSRFCVGK